MQGTWYTWPYIRYTLTCTTWGLSWATLAIMTGTLTSNRTRPEGDLTVSIPWPSELLIASDHFLRACPAAMPPSPHELLFVPAHNAHSELIRNCSDQDAYSQQVHSRIRFNEGVHSPGRVCYTWTWLCRDSIATYPEILEKPGREKGLVWHVTDSAGRLL